MAKNKLYVKLIVDSREQDNSWIDKFNFDKRMSSDGVKIVDFEVHTPFKCLDGDGKQVKTSTGDIGILYSFDEKEWFKTNLSIELKKDSDFSTTLYSSFKRFDAEIDRSIDYGLDFYVVYSESPKKMTDKFDRLKIMKKIPFYTNPEKTVYNNMLKIIDKNIPFIYHDNIAEIVKRIIKHHIQKNKYFQ